MLLILQIGLTIAAWLRGWRAWALIPLGIAFGSGLIMGALGMSGAGVFTAGTIINIVCIAVLIGMVIKRPPS